jgi:hypothetical protein
VKEVEPVRSRSRNRPNDILTNDDSEPRRVGSMEDEFRGIMFEPTAYRS